MALLAIVLPLHGVAVSVFTVMGPAHVHNAAPAAPLVLEDFRRWKSAPVVQAHVLAGLGHFHARATPQRHHHAIDDGTVQRTGGDGPLDGADADGALTPAVVPVLALIPTVAIWAASNGTATAAARAPWSVLTGFTQPLDRPPQRG